MNSEIRATIRQTMGQQELSQVDLAKRLQISPPALSQILSGKRGTVPESLMDVLTALGLTLEAVPPRVRTEGAPIPAPERALTVGVNDWGADGVPTMLEALSAAGVSHLWDVRHSTTSPNPKMQGWAKSNLAAACKVVGIEYLSRRDLGVPKLLRAELTAPGVSDHERREKYAALLEERGVKLEALRAELEGQRVAFLCACKSDGRPCHRFILAELLGLPAQNLAPLHKAQAGHEGES